MASNRDLTRVFHELATALELEGANSFKVSALRRAGRILGTLDRELEALPAKQARAYMASVDGLGAGAIQRVTELLETGQMLQHRELMARVPPGLFRILELPGVGPKAARTLWHNLGVETLEGLSAAIQRGDVEKLPGMGRKSVLNLREAIEWARRAGSRTPLGIARPIAEGLVAQLVDAEGVVRAAYAGSVRRGLDAIGDIDILVACHDPTEVARRFVSQAGLETILAEGQTKVSVRFEVQGRTLQADLRMVSPKCWGAALLYFTGSKEHNVRLRELANRLGLHLNEYGLYKGQEARPHESGVQAIAAADEGSIYQRLGLPFVAPELREDRDLGKLKAASLIEQGDIRSELHSHTTASDGRHSLEELVAIAKGLGYSSLAVTDHSVSSVIAGGLSIEKLLEHALAIRTEAKRHSEFQLLAGTEVDILADGSLDYPDEVLEALDLVVASPHAALQQGTAEATERLLKAVRHPHVDILGHPTGRKVTKREGLRPDMHRVFKEAAAHGTALEINANWRRLDLRDHHVASALAAGCDIAINTDAHSQADFTNLAYGVTTGRRGGLTPENCVNTWDRHRLLAWLRTAGTDR